MKSAPTACRESTTRRACSALESAMLPSQIGGEPSRTCPDAMRSEEHTSELQSHSDLVCRLLLEKKKKKKKETHRLRKLQFNGKIDMSHKRRNKRRKHLMLITKHLI